jgi:hypothetical protein
MSLLRKFVFRPNAARGAVWQILQRTEMPSGPVVLIKRSSAAALSTFVTPGESRLDQPLDGMAGQAGEKIYCASYKIGAAFSNSPPGGRAILSFPQTPTSPVISGQMGFFGAKPKYTFVPLVWLRLLRGSLACGTLPVPAKRVMVCITVCLLQHLATNHDPFGLTAALVLIGSVGGLPCLKVSARKPRAWCIFRWQEA